MLVIAGLDKNNKLKFFYPNSFVYVVMDSDLEEDDEEKLNMESELTDESGDNSENEIDLDDVVKPRDDEKEANSEFPDFYSLLDDERGESDSSTSDLNSDSTSDSTDSEANKRVERSKYSHGVGAGDNSKAGQLNDRFRNFTTNAKFNNNASLNVSASSRNKKSRTQREHSKAGRRKNLRIS